MHPSDDKVGLWLREDNVFYYLETGRIMVGDEIERIRKTLLSRDKKVLQGDKDSAVGGTPTKKMYAAEAREKQYKMEPIYLNSFIRRQFVDDEPKANAKSK